MAWAVNSVTMETPTHIHTPLLSMVVYLGMELWSGGIAFAVCVCVLSALDAGYHLVAIVPQLCMVSFLSQKGGQVI